MNKHIGLSGVSGVGKSTVAEFIQEQTGATYLSLSSFIKTEAQKRGLPMNRDSFAALAKTLRQQLGNAFLAQLAYQELQDKNTPYIIDGIRDPEEIKYFREQNLPIHIMGITVDDFDLLVPRIQKRKKQTDLLDEDSIRRTIQREYSSNELNVKGCLDLCDVLIDNSGDLTNLKQQLQQNLFTCLNHEQQ